VDSAIAKPRLRGVIHHYSFYVAVAAGIVLVLLADGAREHVAASVYAVALAAMLGASALYHRYPWRSPAHRAWARRLDHSTIFLFIAGTYTPFALLRFDGWVPPVVLACVWGGAALGLVLNLAWIDAPKWVTAPAYLLVGWVGVIAAPQLFTEVGVAGGVLVAVGGVLYTLGALAYSFHWPNPAPRWFGFHEVFHVLVAAAAAVQFVAVALIVM
jgi:hemolysin III